MARKRQKHMKASKACDCCGRATVASNFICDGCDAHMCVYCCHYHYENGVSTRWCPECYPIIMDGKEKWRSNGANSQPKWWNPTSTTAWSLEKVEKPPPDPRHVAYKAVDPIEDFFPVISEDIFWEMASWIINQPMLEIGGSFIYDEEKNEIVWAYLDDDAVQQSGHVSSGRGSATAQALAEGFDVPNGQFHTHPGFGSFFSQEDVNDQAEFVGDAAKIAPNGYHVFIVFDQLSWHAVLAEWRDGKPFARHEGFVVVRDQKLNFRKIRPRVYSYTDDQTGKKGTIVYIPDDDKETWEEDDTLGFARLDGEYLTDVPLLEAGEGVEYVDGGGEIPFIDPNKWLYIGDWSNDEDDYQNLFDQFNVRLFDWAQLYLVICNEYGHSNYRDIVDNPEIWKEI